MASSLLGFIPGGVDCDAERNCLSLSPSLTCSFLGDESTTPGFVGRGFEGWFDVTGEGLVT
jgi:hypothetical protein